MLVCFSLLSVGVSAPSLGNEECSLMDREIEDGKICFIVLYLLMKSMDERAAGMCSNIITSIAWRVLALQREFWRLVLVCCGNLINGISMSCFLSRAWTKHEIRVSNPLYWLVPPLDCYELDDLSVNWWTVVVYLFVIGHLTLTGLSMTRRIRCQKC